MSEAAQQEPVIEEPAIKDVSKKFPKWRLLALTLGMTVLWLIGFKYSEPWLHAWHLPVFSLIFILAVFSTLYRATRQINHFVAQALTDHRWVRWFIQARLTSLILALILSLFLTISALVFVFTLQYQAWWILLSGFLLVSLLMLKLTLVSYFKKPVEEISRAYLSVMLGATWMLVWQLVSLLKGSTPIFEPMSIELIEYVRSSVVHSELVFQHIARTSMYIEYNILALAQLDGFSPELVAVLLLFSTSLLPFMALALFVRAVFEFNLKWFIAKPEVKLDV